MIKKAALRAAFFIPIAILFSQKAAVPPSPYGTITLPPGLHKGANDNGGTALSVPNCEQIDLMTEFR